MSMSCCRWPPLAEHDDDGRTRAPALDLPRSPSTGAEKQQASGSASASAGPPSRLGGRRLLRTPSLPTSRVGMAMESPLPTNKNEVDRAAAASASGNQQQPERGRQRAADEVDDDDLNWSSIYEGVLRTRMAEAGARSGLRRAPSMPVPSSAFATATDHHHGHGHGDGDGRRQTKSTPSMPRLLRHSHSTLGRHQQQHHTPTPTPTPTTATKVGWLACIASCHPIQLQLTDKTMHVHQQQQQAMPRCIKQQTSGGDKKCKSSSDLESMEVQGFRDLGFVFEQEELRESLADVLPGLKQQQTQSPRRRRPYLSEAWHQVRRPALARVQSAAEMKDQLRMWAQAVACNVRQEC